MNLGKSSSLCSHMLTLAGIRVGCAAHSHVWQAGLMGLSEPQRELNPKLSHPDLPHRLWFHRGNASFENTSTHLSFCARDPIFSRVFPLSLRKKERAGGRRSNLFPICEELLLSPPALGGKLSLGARAQSSAQFCQQRAWPRSPFLIPAF